MNEESQNSWIEPELEARIVALVLGEASDFEREELNRQIERRPELAAFMLRMQKVHGLLRDVAASEFVPQGEDWKLSADRRNAVLAVIRGEATVQPAIHTFHQLAQQRVSGKRGLRWNVTKVAAVLCVAGFVGVMVLPTYFTPELMVNDRRQRFIVANNSRSKLSADLPHDRVDQDLWSESRYDVNEGRALADPDLAQRGSVLYSPSNKRTPLSTVTNGSSVSALSAIHDTLNLASTLSGQSRVTDDGVSASEAEAFDLPEEDVAQRAITWWEVEGRATATIESGSGQSSIATDSSELIAKNDTIGMDKSLRKDVRDSYGFAIPQPMAPNRSYGTLSLPKPAEIRGEGSDPTSVAASAPPKVDSPDLGKKFLGAIEAPAVSDFAPSAGAPIALLPQILAENEERRFSGTTQGTRSLNETLDSPDAPRSGKESNEWFAGRQDSDYQPAGPEQQEAQRSWGGLAGASRGFSRGGVVASDGREQIDGEHIRNEAKFKDSIDRFSTTDADGAAHKGSHYWFDDGVGLGDKPAGGGRLGGADKFGLNLPSVELSKEMPNGAPVIAPSGIDGVTNFNESGLEEMAVAESAEAKKAWDRPFDEKDKELTKKESAETVRDDDVATQNGPADVNRALDSILTPAPTADTVKDRPAVTFSVNDGNSVTQYSEGLPSKQQGLQVESRERFRGLASEGFDNRFRYVRPTLIDDSDSMKRLAVKAVAPPAGLNEKTAAEEAFSTFSLHVSDVSFKLALAALARGEWPEAAKIRIEEFVNAFDYGDPMPCKGEKVACRVEQSIHPFVQQRNLLRISMRTSAAGRSSNTPLRLTLLLDNSGSMERTDRQQTVRRAFDLLSQQLTAIDQVTLISFARQPRLLADKVSGAESGPLVRLIDELPSEGGTNIEAALQLAFEKAQEQQTPDAQNRIILLTDGAVNLGDADPERLSQMVSTMREAGIAFDAAGISAEGLNDEVLEALTRKGDGRYYLLDSLEAADDGFARQIAGALRPSAMNVKVQIEFNPKRVGSYKLLGFEKHILKQEDFHNDNVDAAEMAAAEAGVAMYQFEAKPDGEGDVGSVSVRFRDLSTGQMIENRWPIPYEADAPRPDQAAPSLRIAASAALLAAKLRGEPLGETVDLQTLSQLMSGLPDQDRNNTRVQQLQLMIEQARQLSEK